MAKIYESPDKGQTVYEREFGAPINTRRLVRESVAADDAAEVMADVAWRESAKNNKKERKKI